MLFWLSVLALLALLVMLVYRYRVTLVSHVPNPLKSLFPSLSHYTPLSTFESQANAGLTSSNFDIEANVRDGDSRAGLDERATQEVMEIMKRERVNFDQARLIHFNRMLAANGIDPSGVPLDAKTVTHL